MSNEHDIEHRTVPSDIHGDVGHQLRKARERCKLSRETVALQLHLDPRVINALENNDFSQLMPVFVRGYLRNYARLVNLPIEPLLESYNGTTDAKKTPLQSQGRSVTARPSRWGLYLLLIALSVPLLLWAANRARFLFGELHIRQPLMDPAITSEAPTPLTQGASPAIRPHQATESISPKPVVTEPSPEPAIRGGTVETELPASAPSTAAAVPGANQPVGQSADKITVNVSADAWVAIRDHTGQRLAFETIPAGTTRTYSGAPPFKIVLGNSPATRIEFNGQPFDQSHYNVGTSARFTLGK